MTQIHAPLPPFAKWGALVTSAFLKYEVPPVVTLSTVAQNLEGIGMRPFLSVTLFPTSQITVLVRPVTIIVLTTISGLAITYHLVINILAR